MTETREIPLRRMPQQVRGQQRIHKLLNAAEQVFAEVGYDNATTNAIAVRAHTSIGSLYQFFPNKEAILKAVVLRYVEEMRALFDQTLTREAVEALSLNEFLERLIHGLAHLYESHASFRPLFFCSQASPEIAEATTELHSEIMDRVDALFATRAPALSQQQRRICTRTSVAIFQSLMSLAMDLQGEERTLQLHEMRTLFLTYLQSYMPESPAAL